MQAIADQLALAQSDIVHHRASNEALLRHNEQLQADLAASDQAIDEAQERQAALLRHNEQLQADLAARDEAIYAAQERQATLLRHNEQLQADLAARDGAMGEFAMTVARQQEEISSLQRLREQQEALDTQDTHGTKDTERTGIPQESRVADDAEREDGLRIVALMAEVDQLKCQREELSMSLTTARDELAAVAVAAAVAEAAAAASAGEVLIAEIAVLRDENRTLVSAGSEKNRRLAALEADKVQAAVELAGLAAQLQSAVVTNATTTTIATTDTDTAITADTTTATAIDTTAATPMSSLLVSATQVATLEAQLVQVQDRLSTLQTTHAELSAAKAVVDQELLLLKQATTGASVADRVTEGMEDVRVIGGKEGEGERDVVRVEEREGMAEGQGDKHSDDNRLVLVEEISHLKAQLAALQGAEGQDQELNALRAVVADQTQTIRALGGEKGALEESLRAVQSDMDGLTARHGDATAEIARLLVKVEKEKERADGLVAGVAVWQSRAKDLEKQLAEVQAQQAQAPAEAEAGSRSLAQAQEDGQAQACGDAEAGAMAVAKAEAVAEAETKARPQPPVGSTTPAANPDDEGRAELQQLRDQLTAHLAESTRAHAALQADKDDLRHRLVEATAVSEGLRLEVADLQSQVEGLSRASEGADTSARKRYEALQAGNEQLQAANEQLHSDVAQLQAVNEQLRADGAQLQTDHAQLHADNVRLVSIEAQWRREVTARDQTIVDLERHVALLQETLHLSSDLLPPSDLHPPSGLQSPGTTTAQEGATGASLSSPTSAPSPNTPTPVTSLTLLVTPTPTSTPAKSRSLLVSPHTGVVYTYHHHQAVLVIQRFLRAQSRPKFSFRNSVQRLLRQMNQRNVELEEKVSALIEHSEAKGATAAASATGALRAHAKKLEKEVKRLKVRIDELESANAQLSSTKSPIVR